MHITKIWVNNNIQNGNGNVYKLFWVHKEYLPKSDSFLSDPQAAESFVPTGNMCQRFVMLW